jgi:alpha-beta hydrolase superfamily lysophospholipase
VSRRVRAALLALSLALAAVGWSGWREWRAATAEFHPPRGPVTWPPGKPEWRGREEASFTSARGDALRGWYAPPRAGTSAAVVLVHGTEADRRQLLDLGAALSAAGLGVLAYDQPGCGESGGRVTWGASERAALSAAVAWAAARPGVRAVGVFGFSQGAYVAAQVAPGDATVRALALAGTPANFRDETRYEFRRPVWLFAVPALLARRAHGGRPTAPEPEDAIAAFSPRPLLVLTGAADFTVPPEHSRRVHRAAGEPKELWVMPAAGHGDYGRADPQDYPRRVVEFFERALSG